MMKAILLVSHGSRSPQTVEEVRQLVQQIQALSDAKVVEYAFLELLTPSIPEGIDRCIRHGADDIVLLLNFLNSGQHVNQDIPHITATARNKYPGVKIRLSKPIGQHQRLPELFVDMIRLGDAA